MSSLISNFVVASTIRATMFRRWRGIGVCVAFVTAALASPIAQAAVVRMETSLGGFNIELLDSAPKTVTNFLDYVSRDAYDFTVIHRSIPGFVVQGGGYNPFFGTLQHIPTNSPVQNEFDVSRSNVRGTIAMAKLSEDAPGGGPDSATSEWFINLADNSGAPNNLDTQNGGFTVFARVIAPGMNVVDAIAALPTSANIPGFPAIPVFNNDFVYVPFVCLNDDRDSACPDDEDRAPNNGDGNADGIPDRDQSNVASPVTRTGDSITFSAASGRILGVAGVVVDTLSAQRVATFPRPESTLVQFNIGFFSIELSGTVGAGSELVTVRDPLVERPTHYYVYGPTAGNPSPHWYDFSFDGTTGAVITPNNIELHFKDGERGDDDLQANGSITHTGAPVTITSTTTTSNASSCSLSQTPVGISRAGDWGVVALFLAFAAGLRTRRAAITGQKR